MMNNDASSIPLICFIVHDGGPAAHFSTYATNLVTQHEFQVHIYATGPALVRLNNTHLPNDIQLISFIIHDYDCEQQEQVARQLIDNCLKQNARTIIIDSGNKFAAIVQNISSKENLLSIEYPFWCYYDNPESYVPGGYSIKTEETIKASKYILFANINLAKTDANIYSSLEKQIDLSNKIIQGIGYYPITETEKLQQQRQIERDHLRKENSWSNIKYLFVYFGGNNDAYFDQAFPNFLSNLSQLNNNNDNIFEDILFLLHQHPAAKIQNRDGLLLEKWLTENRHVQIILSTLKTSDQALIVADAVLYYQTSMSPQFALLEIPTIQVGHEIYQDILVKYNLCYTATNTTELAASLTKMKEKNNSFDEIQRHKQLIYEAIGYTPDWPNNLRRIIFNYK